MTFGRSKVSTLKLLKQIKLTKQLAQRVNLFKIQSQGGDGAFLPRLKSRVFCANNEKVFADHNFGTFIDVYSYE